VSTFNVEKEVAALESFVDRAAAAFPDNPARLDQLRSHITTCQMLIEHLATEVPYVLS
jgi:hypothetical protein